MAYIIPAGYSVSDDYKGHRKRNSAEPGTDYATPYGTPLKAAGSGVVTVVDNNNSGAAGRRVTIDLDDGRRVSYIHLSAAKVNKGQRVKAGQVFGMSGASGFGRDWYYGPHVHVSLWEHPGMAWRDTIDFEPFTISKSVPEIVEIREDEMIYINVAGKRGVRRGGSYMILKDNKGQLFARFCSTTRVKGVPTLTGVREISEWDAVLVNGSPLR